MTNNTQRHPPQLGDFITITVWRVTGCVVATRASMLGTDDTIDVLLETPSAERRWYRLEPADYTIE